MTSTDPPKLDADGAASDAAWQIRLPRLLQLIWLSKRIHCQNFHRQSERIHCQNLIDKVNKSTARILIDKVNESTAMLIDWNGLFVAI